MDNRIIDLLEKYTPSGVYVGNVQQLAEIADEEGLVGIEIIDELTAYIVEGMHSEDAPLYVENLGLFYYDKSERDTETFYGKIRFEFIGNEVGWRGKEMDRINIEVIAWINKYHAELDTNN